MDEHDTAEIRTADLRVPAFTQDLEKAVHKAVSTRFRVLYRKHKGNTNTPSFKRAFSTALQKTFYKIGCEFGAEKASGIHTHLRCGKSFTSLDALQAHLEQGDCPASAATVRAQHAKGRTH